MRTMHELVQAVLKLMRTAHNMLRSVLELMQLIRELEQA